MKCFNHPDRDAVASCHACGKGLCPDCHTLVSDTSACRGNCEERVKDLAAIIRRNAELYKSYSTGKISDNELEIYRTQRKNSIAWMTMFGCLAVYLVVQFVQSLGDKEPALQYIWFLIPVGVILYGNATSFSRYRRMAKNREQVQSIFRDR